VIVVRARRIAQVRETAGTFAMEPDIQRSGRGPPLQGFLAVRTVRYPHKHWRFLIFTG